MEKTFALLKPGVLPRRLVGEVIGRIEKKGFHIAALKMLHITEELAREHYKEHVEKPFFPPLLEYMCSGPVVAMVLERNDAIKVLRKLAGATNPDEADPGTIRGDLGSVTRKNIIHASDSPESAKREIELFFGKDTLIHWEDGNGNWY
jgi:nucleoside-diphosphate kinase